MSGSMSEQITIRSATLADYPGLARVAREVHEYHVALLPHVFRSVASPFPEGYFAGLVTGDDSDILLAERDGAIMGYATLQLRRATLDILVPRTSAHISNFGVSQAARRHGVGRRLFAACREWTRRKGGASLDLECWEANQEAMRFYEEMGMRVSMRTLTIDA
jgi:ribosomal protein S18 acetylase RimI-like enzyme